VRVLTGAEVVAITTEPGGRWVTGVTLADGQHLAADLVVCNRDLPAAYQLLAGSSSNGGSTGSRGTAATPSPAAADYGRQQHERLGRLKYSVGVVSFNWCMAKRIEGLAHHNVFLSQQWRESWAPAARPGDFVRHPNFYVHVPNRTDPTAAPPGCDSVMVLLPVANRQQCSSDYGALVAEGRRRVLQVARWGVALRSCACEQCMQRWAASFSRKQDRCSLDPSCHADVCCVWVQ
jgi:phytoene desaturase (3,4-didehydrolycopene-forming)